MREDVPVAVIEGDGDRVPRNGAGPEPSYQLFHRKHHVVTGDQLHLPLEDLGRQSLEERIAVIVDPMIGEDRERSRPPKVAGGGRQGPGEAGAIESGGQGPYEHLGHALSPGDSPRTCRRCHSSSISTLHSRSP